MNEPSIDELSITALLIGGERVLIDTDLGPLDVIQGLDGIPPYAELRSRATSAGLASLATVWGLTAPWI